MKTTITKDSVRKLVRRGRLPHRFRMFVASVWLYDVLEANGLNKKFHLWEMSYWVSYHSLNSKHARLIWGR